jgi:hypothetical protein
MVIMSCKFIERWIEIKYNNLSYFIVSHIMTMKWTMQFLLLRNIKSVNTKFV